MAYDNRNHHISAAFDIIVYRSGGVETLLSRECRSVVVVVFVAPARTTFRPRPFLQGRLEPDGWCCLRPSSRDPAH